MLGPTKFALAIRLTESQGDPHAYGDGGLALTSYQVHPAWLWGGNRMTELDVALTLEAVFQVWIGPCRPESVEPHNWSPRMKQVLESNGTRSRWLEMVRRELWAY